MLVSIGMTSGNGLVTSTYAASLFNLCLWSKANVPSLRLAVTDAQSSIVANARNQCVEAAISQGAEMLLMIDSDIRFPYDTLARLLSHNKPVVGGLYRRRGPPHEVLGTPLSRSAGEYEGLVEMEVVPTGCLLVDMRVFSMLPPPYFRFGIEADRIIGEDVQFCRDVRAKGLSLFADCSIELGHIGTMVLE